MDRNKAIIRTSITGIAVNMVLVAFKMMVGLISNSISIVMDAVNNLSDAMSSIITIIGTKLANRAPDRKHPYGYGQIEYVSSVTIAVIVLLAGATSFVESVKKVIEPAEVDFSAVTLLVVVAGIITKFFLGRYVKGQGEKYNSESLIASGSDALFDSIISSTTLASGLIYIFLHINVEGILGAVISAVIFRSGLEILMESLSNIIGMRIDSELTISLKQDICSIPEVKGAYDLALHRYGPQKIIGSVHIELDDDLTTRDIHHISQQITGMIYAKYGIILTVGIYASNTGSELGSKMFERIREAVSNYPEIIQVHGFYVDESLKTASFDLVYDYGSDKIIQIRDSIIEKMKQLYPDYEFTVILDNDYSD